MSIALQKVVVTGGAGFIGSHVVDRLLADKIDVVVIDNFSNGRADNLVHHQGNKQLTVIQADVNDLKATKVAYENADGVVHLAALADIVPSIEKPLDYHHANVSGTIAVLEQARHAGVRRFVYAASSSCYGIPDIYPTPETAPIQPMYPYALTKYLGEQYALRWHQFYGLPVVSLRFFNVYGPRSRTTGTYGAVFGVFLAQKIHGQPFTVVGDGKQSRDFTYVTDVVEAIVRALKSNVSGDVFNVGSGGHYCVNQLTKLLGNNAVEHLPKRPGEPDQTFADITKISHTFKWSPKVSFENGVAQMLEHIEDWRKAPVWTAQSIQEATQEWFNQLGDNANE